MKKIIIAVAVVLVITFAIFWQVYLRGYMQLPSAERFMDSFYTQYDLGEYQYIYEVLSHQKIRSRLTPDLFNQRMADTKAQLGKIIGRKRMQWKALRSNQGDMFLIAYNVGREKIQSVESFTLIRNNQNWYVYDYVVRGVKK